MRQIGDTVAISRWCGSPGSLAEADCRAQHHLAFRQSRHSGRRVQAQYFAKETPSSLITMALLVSCRIASLGDGVPTASESLSSEVLFRSFSTAAGLSSFLVFLFFPQINRFRWSAIYWMYVRNRSSFWEFSYIFRDLESVTFDS